MAISIRPAKADDIPDLLRLNAEVHALHVDAKPEFFQPAAPNSMSDLFAERLSSENSMLWVAQDDQETVGYLVAIIKQRPANAFSPARRWFDIEEIGVASDQRRQGIGNRLIETTIASAKQLGIDDIELTVWAFNGAARQAFQRMGFTAQNTRMTYQK
ncbi:MAG: GNAT family N-acetyltransferase [Planctomycetota bacterium]